MPAIRNFKVSRITEDRWLTYLVVELAIEGNAVYGVDYSATGMQGVRTYSNVVTGFSLTIPAGVRSAQISAIALKPNYADDTILTLRIVSQPTLYQVEIDQATWNLKEATYFVLAVTGGAFVTDNNNHLFKLDPT